MPLSCARWREIRYLHKNGIQLIKSDLKMSECLAMSKGKATDGERRGEEGSASGRAHNPIEWWQKPEAKQSQQRPCKKGGARGTVCLDGSGYLAGKDNNFINKYLCAEQKLPFLPSSLSSSLLPLPLRSFSVSLLNSTIWR